jgi:hypothetical protein
MKPKHHTLYTIHVAKKLTPPAIWEWLLAALDTPFSTREVIELLPEGDLAIEYHDKMRSQS